MTDRDRDDAFADGAALARRDRKAGRNPRYTPDYGNRRENPQQVSPFVTGYLTLVGDDGRWYR